MKSAVGCSLLICGHLGMKRFFALDHQAYEPGSLPTKTKELLGLVASAVLRCDDCITYHLARCGEEGWSRNEVIDALNVAMFLAAFLLPPARPDTRVPDKARELGARAVVDGGSYQPGDDRPAAVRLFVGRESISALNTSLRPLLVILTAKICNVRAFPNEGHWILRVEWADRTPADGGCSAEFSYRGFFAEHLARVALSALKSVLRAPPSDFQQHTQDLQSRAPAGRGKAAGA